MADVTLSNDDLLGAVLALRHAKATNALASVKLSKIRKSVAAETEHVATAFDGIGQRHAAKNEAGAPKVVERDGQPISWIATGTPVYEIAADAKADADAESKTLMAATVTLSVPLLTAVDLASIEVAEDIGAALAPFTEGV